MVSGQHDGEAGVSVHYKFDSLIFNRMFNRVFLRENQVQISEICHITFNVSTLYNIELPVICQ